MISWKVIQAEKEEKAEKLRIRKVLDQWKKERLQ